MVLRTKLFERISKTSHVKASKFVNLTLLAMSINCYIALGLEILILIQSFVFLLKGE